jgi:hypothetical protein
MSEKIEKKIFDMGSQYATQAALELSPPASAFWMLGLRQCTAMLSLKNICQLLLLLGIKI